MTPADVPDVPDQPEPGAGVGAGDPSDRGDDRGDRGDRGDARDDDRADDWGDDWGDAWDDDWGGDGSRGRGERAAPGLDDPRVAAGVEHLQRAAREVIAASRALLDAAEDLVDQPDGITRLAGVVADLGDLAGRTVRAAAAGAGPRAGRRPGGPGTDDPDDEPPVQRIPVS